jgi:hypothetical protein
MAICASGIQQFFRLKDGYQRLMPATMTQLNLSARAYHRIMKLARTIADLAGSLEIQSVPPSSICAKSMWQAESLPRLALMQCVFSGLPEKKVYQPNIDLPPKQTLPLVRPSFVRDYLMNAILGAACAVAVVMGR